MGDKRNPIFEILFLGNLELFLTIMKQVNDITSLHHIACIKTYTIPKMCLFF